MKLIISIFVIFFYFSYANSNNNIVFLDVQYLIDNSNLGKKYKKEILKLKDQNDSKLNVKEEKIKEKEIEINNQKNILKEEELKKKIIEIEKMIKEFRILNRELSSKITQQRKLYSAEILKMINPILTNYAEQNNINYVLEKKNVLVGMKSLDITTQVLNKLNEYTEKQNLINEPYFCD